MPTIDLDGHPLHFTDSAIEAPVTLLLIHGAGGSARIWPATFRELAGARVIAVDLPGHGQSAPPGRRTIHHYTTVVERFIAAMGLERVVLGGHSMGAAIALTAALQSPAVVQGLVLMGSSARMPVADVLLGGALSSLEEAANFVVEHGLPNAAPELQALVREDLLATGAATTFGDFLACSRFDLRPHLGGINQPALALIGAEDRLVQPRFMESLAHGLPQGQAHRLPGAGHFAMLEQPVETAGHIQRFLSGLAAR
jgi:pimeloyl-ACP methyl ester carboxylesterase